VLPAAARMAGRGGCRQGRTTWGHQTQRIQDEGRCSPPPTSPAGNKIKDEGGYV